MVEQQLEFYMIRNKEGKYFRSKGYGGGGDNWVDDIGRGKVYHKIGSARGTVGYWANHYPSYGVPDIIKLTVSQVEVINEADRIKEAKEKKEARKKGEDLRAKQRQLQVAEKELALAKRRYSDLCNKGT